LTNNLWSNKLCIDGRQRSFILKIGQLQTQASFLRETDRDGRRRLTPNSCCLLLQPSVRYNLNRVFIVSRIECYTFSLLAALLSSPPMRKVRLPVRIAIVINFFVLRLGSFVANETFKLKNKTKM